MLYYVRNLKQAYLLSIFVLFSSVAQAQTSWRFPFPVDTTTHEVSYQGVVQVPNTTRATLYSQAKAWHARVVEAATQVPLKADEAAGLFIGKRIALVGDQRFVYTVAVECRDGQYEYLFTQFQLLKPATNTPTEIPGRRFVTFPSMVPLLEIVRAPASLTPTGEVQPAIQKMLTKANLTFELLVDTLQQAMAKKS